MRKIKFSRLADFLGTLVIDKKIYDDFELSAITSNSSAVTENSLFCAVKGVNVDGNSFAEQAFANGAAGIISTLCYEGKNYIQVKDDRLAYSEAMRFFHGEPDSKLNFIGVTGTNGKTTSVYCMYELLRDLSRKTAILTTIISHDGKESRDSDCTTPDARLIFDFCSRAVQNNCEFLAMECSSHALSQKRTGLVKFKAAVFTNLTEEHSDYHLNMDDYFAAKKILFVQNLASDGTAIINIDDAYGARLAAELREMNVKTVTFGFAKNADMKMQIIDNEFVLNGEKVEFSLFGKHNFYNVTGVLAALQSLGFDFRFMLDILRRKNISVPGRLEKIDLGNHGTAFVDYAHTPDALYNVLNILKQEAVRRKGRLICVFGCGGNRDRNKRPHMGKTVSEFADEFIVTSDNPRNESPEVIIEEILSGCLKNPFLVECDRRTAIEKAVQYAGVCDIILVAGKGHEKYQQTGDTKIYFDDCEELQKALERCRE